MDAQSWLEADVAEVAGVTRAAATVLRETFGVTNVRELLEHYPHQDKYRDVGEQVALKDAAVGQAVTIVGTVLRWNVFRARKRRMTIVKATVADEHGGRVEVPFFNQEWWPRRIPEGRRVAASGTLERFRDTLRLKNPKLVELSDQETGPVADRVQVTYPATEALPSHRIAKFVAAALDVLPPIPDHLPDALRAGWGLLGLDAAVRTIHRPPDLGAVEPARTRLVYDELLTLQVGLQRRRQRLESRALGLVNEPRTDGFAQALLDRLPFTPTASQSRAFAELGADLARPKPMHRLLQGDVGSGKTLVGAWAMLTAVDNGRQAVLMAPTEVLAEQHLRTFTALLEPLRRGYAGSRAPGGGDRPGADLFGGPRLELLTGATSAKQLRGLLAELAAGTIDLLIGTHALLEERVTFADLGVVIVDEQHRFGVEHRKRLRDKRGHAVDASIPDVLVMTATPIPRSLALTVYGDLDVTVLDELPPGRQPVHTEILPTGSPRRQRLYDYVRTRVVAGERAYVVCPLVEDSNLLRVEEPGGGDRSVASAETTHARLAADVFPDLTVGLVHGRLPAAARDETMEAFRDGRVQVLVATTVIEVGVDVPEATIMVIEDADRFGISQLHQLRGRVGRARARSYCVLFSSASEDNARLEAVAATTDGFRLAERDLELRGEGSLFATRQSGLPDLKLARLAQDIEWVARSREDARGLVEEDPDLRSFPPLRDEVARRYGEERLAELEAG
ncbi:MAG TPA: ATP-dependent DNA helicase RecG [Egibacteraceae bacterium]|nr:ATP-dependent DNA helicase RecG [Egibacteraceae bacterium]